MVFVTDIPIRHVMQAVDCAIGNASTMDISPAWLRPCFSLNCSGGMHFLFLYVTKICEAHSSNEIHQLHVIKYTNCRTVARAACFCWVHKRALLGWYSWLITLGCMTTSAGFHATLHRMYWHLRATVLLALCQARYLCTVLGMLLPVTLTHPVPIHVGSRGTDCTP